MTPDERSLLERTAHLAEENNKILRKMRSNSRVGTVIHVIYWIIILGVSFGAYYFIQPYLAPFMSVMTSMNGVDWNAIMSNLPK